jgi:hypothetical protein
MRRKEAMNNFDQVPDPRPMRAVHWVALRREIQKLGGAAPRRWRRSSVAIVLGISGMAGGVGVAAAAVYVHYKKVTNITTAHCYSLPRLGDNGTTIAVLSATTGSSQVTDALGTCGMLWRDGFLAPGVSQIVHVTETTTVHPVPNLVVCTMPNGTAGVFPGKASTCSVLGLSQPKPSTTSP